MNRRSKYLNNHGYTLIEIIMVIVILGVIGAFTFQMVAAGVQAFKKSSARKDLYDQGRLALERMVRELRDGKEIVDCSSNSITFKKAHPAQAADNIEEVKFELVGTDLKRVGDPSGTPQTAILASNVTGFQVSEGGGGGGSGSVTVDSSSSGSTSGTSGITISHTVAGSNRLMLVGVSINNDSSETVTSVTYNGDPLTLEGTETNSDDARIEIWSLVAPDIGTYNVVITFSAALEQEAVAGVVSFNGVDQSTPLGTFVSAQADDSTPATVNIPSEAGELVFGAVAAEYDAVIASSGQTEHWNVGVPQTYGAGGTATGASPGVTMSWNLVVDATPDNHWAIGGVSIKPAATSGSTICSSGTGSILLDNVNTDVSNANPQTFTHTIGGGTNRLLVVGVSAECNEGITVSSVTYNGQPLTKAASVVADTGTVGLADLWYLLEASLPPAGTYNVEVTTSGYAVRSVGAISLEGVAQQAPEDTNTSTNVGPNSISTSINTLTDGAWVVDVAENGNPSDLTPYGGQTEQYEEVASSSVGAASTKEMATAGSTSVGWSSSSANRLAHVVAAFAPAAASSTLVPLNLTLSSPEGGTVTMRTKVYMRNLP